MKKRYLIWAALMVVGALAYKKSESARKVVDKIPV